SDEAAGASHDRYRGVPQLAGCGPMRGDVRYRIAGAERHRHLFENQTPDEPRPPLRHAGGGIRAERMPHEVDAPQAQMVAQPQHIVRELVEAVGPGLAAAAVS